MAVAVAEKTAPDVSGVKRVNKLKRRNTLLGWSFILPNFLGFALFTMVPILMLFYLAFTNAKANRDSNWIGLDNFTRLFRNSSFWTAFGNTFYYAIPHIVLTLALSLGLAILLNRKIKGVAFFRAAAFFPYITSIVAVAIVWNLMFSPDYGPVNQILRFLGLDNPPCWTSCSSASMPALIIVGTWREMGYYMVLFLAGLQTIPKELYEAASMDGAGPWKQFLNVTWPGLRPTTFFVTVILTIESFKILDLVIVMTDGGPGTSTTVLAQYIYQKSIKEGEFGYASAASLVLFFVCLVITLVQFIGNKRLEK
jgi:ABC-type sugar transport system permease subunit